MNENSRQQLIDLLQQMAEIVVLDDSNNERTIELLRQLIERFSVLAVAENIPCADTALAAVELFKRSGEDEDAERELFEAIGRSVSDLQIMMNEECNRPKSTDIHTSEKTAQVDVSDVKTDAVLFEADTGIVIFDDPALFAEFAVESRENLDSIETKLLALESSPENFDEINAVFRMFHTIKGAAACLRFDSISDFAHKTEDFLNKILQEKKISTGDISMLLESTDTLRDMVEESVGMQVKHPNGSDATASEEDCTAKSKIRSTGTTGKKTVRLDADRFDRLIDLISELTVSESMVVNDSDLQFVKSPVLERKLSHLDKITKDIQWIAMSLRMVPLRVTFQKMYRLSRDLAVRFNKKIEFVMSGESTELDKSIVDGIGDPLLHIVRNMVDHGIEPVSDRIKAGKSETGRIELRAYHKGSSIYIEISDDGRGLDYKAIAASALEKGLIDSTENYSEAQLTELIFLPSFSTSRMVTDISGRGVGLDVVKRSIEMLQGTVELRSKSGLGTTFILRLPLTLAIMDGLVVRSGIEDYIVPTLNVVSAVRPSPNSIQSVLHQGEIMRYRDSTIPIVRLSRLFGTNDNERDIPDSIVLIIEEEERNIGLMVDKLIGKQQFAVKKLNEGISRAPGISGCTIMPDGSVGLILGAGDFIRTALKLAAHEHSFNGSIAE